MYLAREIGPPARVPDTQCSRDFNLNTISDSQTMRAVVDHSASPGFPSASQQLENFGIKFSSGGLVDRSLRRGQ